MIVPHAGVHPIDGDVPDGPHREPREVPEVTPVPEQERRGSTPVRTVSVVGGKGFLGSRIAGTLRAGGHRVHVLDRQDPVVAHDRLTDAAAGSGWVVWAASSINPMIAENDPDRVALDVAAFDAFLAALEAAGDARPRVALLSSGGTVYDELADPPHTEDSPTVPRSAYGRAKLTLEHHLLAAAPDSVVLRVSNAYGPGQQVAPGQGVVAHWLHALATHQPLHVFGDPAAVARDYVHVDDIARAARLLVEDEPRTEQVLNIGAGRATSLAELLEAVTAATGAAPEVRYHEARAFDARATWLDCTRASRTLGWTPRVALRDGIAGAWQAVRTAARAQGATRTR